MAWGLRPDQDVNERNELAKLLSQFKTAMLVTRESEAAGGDGAPAAGQLRARPMAIADIEDISTLRFVTSVDSDKVDEMLADDRVMVTMQSASAYITITGTAKVSNDKGKLEEIWKPALDAWFDEGLDDPRAALIEVQGTFAEFWEMSAPSKLRYMFEMARARLTDEKVDTDAAGTHVQLEL